MISEAWILRLLLDPALLILVCFHFPVVPADLDFTQISVSQGWPGSYVWEAGAAGGAYLPSCVSGDLSQVLPFCSVTAKGRKCVREGGLVLTGC